MTRRPDQLAGRSHEREQTESPLTDSFAGIKTSKIPLQGPSMTAVTDVSPVFFHLRLA
jgi:hypothetical protein